METEPQPEIWGPTDILFKFSRAFSAMCTIISTINKQTEASMQPATGFFASGRDRQDFLAMLSQSYLGNMSEDNLRTIRSSIKQALVRLHPDKFGSALNEETHSDRNITVETVGVHYVINFSLKKSRFYIKIAKKDVASSIGQTNFNEELSTAIAKKLNGFASNPTMLLQSDFTSSASSVPTQTSSTYHTNKADREATRRAKAAQESARRAEAAQKAEADRKAEQRAHEATYDRSLSELLNIFKKRKYDANYDLWDFYRNFELYFKSYSTLHYTFKLLQERIPDIEDYPSEIRGKTILFALACTNETVTCYFLRHIVESTSSLYASSFSDLKANLNDNYGGKESSAFSHIKNSRSNGHYIKKFITMNLIDRNSAEVLKYLFSDTFLRTWKRMVKEYDVYNCSFVIDLFKSTESSIQILVGHPDFISFCKKVLRCTHIGWTSTFVNVRRDHSGECRFDSSHLRSLGLKICTPERYLFEIIRLFIEVDFSREGTMVGGFTSTPAHIAKMKTAIMNAQSSPSHPDGIHALCKELQAIVEHANTPPSSPSFFRVNKRSEQMSEIYQLLGSIQVDYYTASPRARANR